MNKLLVRRYAHPDVAPQSHFTCCCSLSFFHLYKDLPEIWRRISYGVVVGRISPEKVVINSESSTKHCSIAI